MLDSVKDSLCPGASRTGRRFSPKTRRYPAAGAMSRPTDRAMAIKISGLSKAKAQRAELVISSLMSSVSDWRRLSLVADRVQGGDWTVMLYDTASAQAVVDLELTELVVATLKAIEDTTSP